MMSIKKYSSNFFILRIRKYTIVTKLNPYKINKENFTSVIVIKLSKSNIQSINFLCTDGGSFLIDMLPASFVKA